jgi:peptidylprolyl isomerase
VRRSIAVLATAFLVAGCAGSKGSAAPAPTVTSPSQTAASPSSTGPFTAVGAYGHEPTITFPAGAPPKDLVKTVVTEGTGPAVVKGDLLVGHYVGQVWGSATPFDSSYKRNAMAGFPIGVGAVVPGWDETLVGVKAGSRVLLSLPPAKGYGTAGNTGAGIKGTDTIVFVVDVVASYTSTLGGATDATPQNVTIPGITIGGSLGKQPTVKVAKGTAEPKKNVATILAKGAGAPAVDGLAVLQFEAVDWSNAPAGSTWTNGGLQSATLGGGGPLDSIRGVPIGSRVLVQLPKDTGKTSPHPSIAIVVDVVAQPAAPA